MAHHSSADLRILAGNRDPDGMPRLRPLVPFDDAVLAFFDALSKILMKAGDNRARPDVTTFGFFCRKANLNNLKKRYGNALAHALGRGVALHFAPANVPINLAYSLLAGLLAGNACIVRASTKDFPQTAILCEAIESVLAQPENASLRNYLSIVQYEHSDAINASLSSLCDVRIIWGGDASIAEIRKAPLPPRAFDLTFADRVSLCVVQAGRYLAEADKPAIARHFYNDTYLFDQNACSSPRLVFWVGEAAEVEQAQAVFWTNVQDVLGQKHYAIDPITTVDKLATAYRAALDFSDVSIVDSENRLVTRIRLTALPQKLHDYVCPGGLFYEFNAANLEPLAGLIDRKYQTLSYIGFEVQDIFAGLKKFGVNGIDRIVPCGQATDFDLIWDGYDLIRQMSRTTNCR